MRLVTLSLLLLTATSSFPLCADGKPATPPAVDQRQGVFAKIQANKANGSVSLDIASFDKPFLLIATLENALGSNDIGLDRAQNNEPMLVEFRRIGKRALLVQLNTRFVANSTDADEAKAATDAFAESVVWAADITSDAATPAAALVNINSLLLTDFVGVADRLRLTQQGNYSLDASRSAVLAGEARSFSDNAEFISLLTFAGAGEGKFVQQIAADPKSLTVKQRLSFVRLPGPGFAPRAYHPASGAYSIGHYDFAQAIVNNIDQRVQPRFRLEKIDPTAARSKVVKPIVFYLDRGTPEPIRSALLEGVNWWKEAFDAAGFIDAFRAELAPPGMDMSDTRYNTITWTHRATRGWSYGGGLIDPRTGEIIKGYVNLGSQRVRQDLLIAEGLLAPYRKGADPALLKEAEAMALQRLRQLGAHEVGHALGFAHNFAASRTGDSSVLDYPHPVVELGPDGRPRLRQPYGNGIGEWDKFLVAHAYGVFAKSEEAAELAKLRAGIAAAGYAYVSEGDARAPGDAHQAGVLWDIPGDAIDGLQKLLRVRQVALEGFAEGALPPDRQLGDAERRLVPIYLLHRYQADAVIRLIGGSTYQYGLVGDTASDTIAVDGERQRKALAATRQMLALETLSIPDSVLRVMTAPSNEYSRGPEYFGTRMSPVFDPLQASASASALVAQLAFNPLRLNRLAWQSERNADIPSTTQVFDSLITQPWQEDGRNKQQTLILATRNWVLLDAALLTLDGGQLHPAVAAQWTTSLRSLAKQLEASKNESHREASRYILRYLADPASIKLRTLPTVPPGAPI